jgi:hypothetical protein
MLYRSRQVSRVSAAEKGLTFPYHLPGRTACAGKVHTVTNIRWMDHTELLYAENERPKKARNFTYNFRLSLTERGRIRPKSESFPSYPARRHFVRMQTSGLPSKMLCIKIFPRIRVYLHIRSSVYYWFVPFLYIILLNGFIFYASVMCFPSHILSSQFVRT